MNDLILQAIANGAELHCSLSGGKDGQAMVKALDSYNIKPTSIIHADLGSVEWDQSMGMCERLATQFNVPLHVVTRADGAGLLEHWEKRMVKLAGTGKPFWSSSTNRYCTSDLKRDVIDKFFRNRECNLIISAEGIRAQESDAREAKTPLTIRTRITSTYYAGMTVEEAIAAYNPAHRLALTWYPIFNWSLDEVWGTYGHTASDLTRYRFEYIVSGTINPAWQFHPAYVMGNNRVSCVICILGDEHDIKNGAKHKPQVAAKMMEMEVQSGATFKSKKSLSQILN